MSLMWGYVKKINMSLVRVICEKAIHFSCEGHNYVRKLYLYLVRANVKSYSCPLGGSYVKVGSHYERLFQRWPAFEKSNK